MEQKKMLEKCKIYKEPNNQYDVHEFAENYYGKIILEELTKNGTELDYESKPNKILIEESGIELLIENFEFLKINPPKIVTLN